jgi:hypothetical protein
MNKGKIIAFRVAETMHEYLMQQAETDGCTISDVARDIIIEHVRVEDPLRALQEIGKGHSQEIAQLREEMKNLTAGFASMKRGNLPNGDIERILLIVETLGRASPFVSSQLSHLWNDGYHKDRLK